MATLSCLASLAPPAQHQASGLVQITAGVRSSLLSLADQQSPAGMDHSLLPCSPVEAYLGCSQLRAYGHFGASLRADTELTFLK